MPEYDIVDAFKQIENELIASMIRNMDHHRAEEDAEGFSWSMWQVEQLKALEQYKQQNQEKYSEEFKSINREIDALIRQARDTGSMEQEISILNAIRKGYQPPKDGSRLTGQFFRLNERKLETLIQTTTRDMKKAETAVLRMANDQYRKAIFNAQVYANAGGTTYEKAVDMATRDMLKAGLNCVEYKNKDGQVVSRHTLPDYADMAIRTANKRAYLQGEGTKRQEWGISTVVINKRGNPCPKCLPWVGKVLIDDVWSAGSDKNPEYPLMSEAVAAGLYHPRCRDNHSTFFPGISTADDTWTDQELEAIRQEGKEELKQQTAARQAVKHDRLAQNSLDTETKKKEKKLTEEWSEAAKNGIMDKNFKDQIIEGLPDMEILEDNTGRKRFAKSLVDKLNIDSDDIKISVRKTDNRGQCSFFPNGDSCNYHEYVLQSYDDRAIEYKAKTAFHEAYHLSLQGGKWDVIQDGKLNFRWIDIEETFAETSAHYAMKMTGHNTLAPAYAEKLIQTLPRMKQLDEFKECSSMVDFGRIAWNERMAKKTGIWGGLYDKVFSVDFDEVSYYKGYFDTIQQYEDELFDKMFENSPSYRYYQSRMKRSLQQSIEHYENGGTFNQLNSNQKMVFSNILINAMIKEGIH